MNGFYNFLRTRSGDVLLLIIFAVFIGTVVRVGLAPQPEDPFFPVWLDVTQYGWKALLIAVPGVGGAAYVVLRLLPDSGGF